jgi:3-oxoacyl-[acyl-carrier protein] reductase
MGKLAGKVALVTGGGRGVGRSLVAQLAAEGARIVVNDLDAEPAEEAVKAIRAAGGEAVACVGSVTDRDFPRRFLDTAIDRFGDAHILVNNAGYIWNGLLHRISDEQWDAIQEVHLRAPFRILRAFHGAVRNRIEDETRAGAPIHRKVVNISSVAATGGLVGHANYSAAKAGLIGLTRTLAKEWGLLRINVNCVAFGFIETRLTQPVRGETVIEISGVKHRVGLTQEALQTMTERIALGRPGTPDEAAGAVLLLCLPQADYVTGQVLEADGGLVN